MTKGDIYPQKISSQDPHLFIKNMISNSANYIHDQTRQDKDRFYNITFYSVSLLATAIFSLFSSILALLFLANALLVILIISTSNYKKKRKKFWKNREVIKSNFKAWGMEWRD